eukprot:CFRG2408T1
MSVGVHNLDTDLSDDDGARCAICLCTVTSRSLLDQCFHEFCYVCILQWADVSRSCPLCKTLFVSIIYDIHSDRDYKLNSLPSEPAHKREESTEYNSSIGHRYRTTVVSRNGFPSSRLSSRPRSHSGWGRNGLTQVRRQMVSGAAARLHSPRLMASMDTRRLVYALRLRYLHVGSNQHSRFTSLTPKFYQKHPHHLNRLVPFITRDLQVILQVSDVELVNTLVLGLLERFDVQSEEFAQHLRPFLFEKTEQFTHELLGFMRSPFDMVGYDNTVQYSTPGTQFDSAFAHDEQAPSCIQPANSLTSQSDTREQAHTSTLTSTSAFTTSTSSNSTSNLDSEQMHPYGIISALPVRGSLPQETQDRDPTVDNVNNTGHTCVSQPIGVDVNVIVNLERGLGVNIGTRVKVGSDDSTLRPQSKSTTNQSERVSGPRSKGTRRLVRSSSGDESPASSRKHSRTHITYQSHTTHTTYFDSDDTGSFTPTTFAISPSRSLTPILEEGDSVLTTQRKKRKRRRTRWDLVNASHANRGHTAFGINSTHLCEEDTRTVASKVETVYVENEKRDGGRGSWQVKKGKGKHKHRLRCDERSSGTESSRARANKPRRDSEGQREHRKVKHKRKHAHRHGGRDRSKSRNTLIYSNENIELSSDSEYTSNRVMKERLRTNRDYKGIPKRKHGHDEKGSSESVHLLIHGSEKPYTSRRGVHIHSCSSHRHSDSTTDGSRDSEFDSDDPDVDGGEEPGRDRIGKKVSERNENLKERDYPVGEYIRRRKRVDQSDGSSGDEKHKSSIRGNGEIVCGSNEKEMSGNEVVFCRPNAQLVRKSSSQNIDSNTTQLMSNTKIRPTSPNTRTQCIFATALPSSTSTSTARDVNVNSKKKPDGDGMFKSCLQRQLQHIQQHLQVTPSSAPRERLRIPTDVQLESPSPRRHLRNNAPIADPVSSRPSSILEGIQPDVHRYSPKKLCDNPVMRVSTERTEYIRSHDELTSCNAPDRVEKPIRSYLPNRVQSDTRAGLAPHHVQYELPLLPDTLTSEISDLRRRLRSVDVQLEENRKISLDILRATLLRGGHVEDTDKSYRSYLAKARKDLSKKRDDILRCLRTAHSHDISS